VQSMIRNFSYFIDQFGFIPNGNRSYFLSRSQPPFFACMVSLLAEEKGELIFVEYLPFLKREYAYWMEELGPSEGAIPAEAHIVRLPLEGVLNRYWDRLNRPRAEMYGDDVSLFQRSGSTDPQFYRNIRSACESGWDFSSRWLLDPMDLGSIHTLDILPVDLNCLLWKLEKVIAQGYEVAGIPDQAQQFQQLAAHRKTLIQDTFWDGHLSFFTDYDFQRQHSKGILSLAGMYPLFFQLATPEQAALCAETLEAQFLKAGGLVSTTLTTGQQWDAPNGWAPLQWISIQGLRNYGYHKLAEEIRMRWIYLNGAVYKRTGKMLEKYNVVDLSLEGGGGEYPVQDGFGWTNGVFLCLEGG
ncbi:MAG: trehalase family glycosidase, partial [Bacteroidota bacterium]